MSSEIRVHEIRKDGEGKVKIPNNMFSINGNSYDENHPEGIKFVTEYQHILSIYDPKTTSLMLPLKQKMNLLKLESNILMQCYHQYSNISILECHQN